ncbi:MAG: D-alanyl-D-alanine carboxypeptidase family protein [Bacillota bacterium]|nr:D-alanyl-D-alanine carboxypeptidase family protein [Bacillota bacterium]
MKKKIKVLVFLIIIIIFLLNNTSVVFAEDIYINAKCAIALDSKTRTVLYEKNAYMLVPMASTTKIMTSLVAIKYGNLDKEVEISRRAAGMRGSTVGYKVGEKISIRELLYGLMFRSGNDAAIAIAEGISGNVDEFLKLMNEYAAEIGAFNTHFESPHGLDSDNHYCTAYDLAIITAKAKENSLFNEIVSRKDIDGKQLGFTRSYHNINKLLYQLPSANGVKTGYTGKAGKCLVSSVNIQGHDVIIVVLNCTPRWKETTRIYDYINKTYEYKKIYEKNQVVKVDSLVNKKLKVVCPEDVVVPIKKTCGYDIKLRVPNNPIENIVKGEQYGALEVWSEDKMIYCNSLVSGDNINKKIQIKKWFFKK